MIKVKSARYVDGYTLDVTFSDGTRGDVDLTKMLTPPIFAPLREKNIFRQVSVVRGVIRWPGDFDVAPEYVYALAHNLPLPETGDVARSNEIEMSLRELRRLAGENQTTAAKKMGVHQSEFSRFERRNDHKLSALRNYVESIGGKLEVTVVLGRKRILLSAPRPESKAPAPRALKAPRKTEERPRARA